MAVLNARLGRALGEPLHAPMVLFVVGVIFVWVLGFSLTGRVPSVSAMAEMPKINLAGGIFVAFYVVSATFIAPRFGVGNFILFAMVAQILIAAVIDHWGLFGAVERPVSLLRIGGLVVMVSGLAIAQVAVQK